VLPYTQRISRGDGAVQEFGEKQIDISSIKVNFRNRDMQLEEYLKESHCDGLLVLEGNDVVYENYRRMEADDRHLCQSVSKTTDAVLMPMGSANTASRLMSSNGVLPPGLGTSVLCWRTRRQVVATQGRPRIRSVQRSILL